MNTKHEPLYVIKRNGEHCPARFDAITERIKDLCMLTPVLEQVDYFEVAQKVIMELKSGMTTSQIDNLASEIAAYMSTYDPQYEDLAGRIKISDMHKETNPSFSKTVEELFYLDKINELNTGDIQNEKKQSNILNDDFYRLVMANADRLDAAIVHERDYLFDYFGYKTLEKSYLKRKVDNRLVERPQYLWMRVALAIHTDDIDAALESYNLMSQLVFTHATPTLYNSGTCDQQFSSCFLLPIVDDSIRGIYETLMYCALISKAAGGIGVSASNIRASESYIRGTGGKSNGIIPMLRVFNDTARYVDQGVKCYDLFSIYF
jgi:ribonucleotide reductase alpha subunit